MEFLLLALFSLVIIIEFAQNKSLLNANMLIMGPYVAITVINNFIATKYGFFRILSEVIVLMSLTIVLFFIGTLLQKLYCRTIKEKIMKWINNILPQTNFKKCNEEYGDYGLNYKYMEVYVFIVLLLRFIQIFSMYYNNGLSYLYDNDFAAMRLHGTVGHLLLSTFPLQAILFYKGVKEKKYRYIALVTFGAFLVFASFIKYHVISLAIIIYLYCSFKEKKYFQYGTIIVIFSVILLFLANYFVSFVMRKWEVSNSFYLYHLWKYIAGGTINFNWVIENLPMLSYSVKDWLMGLFTAFPNMILNRLFNFSFNFNRIGIGFEVVGIGAKYGPAKSNVISIIGMLYATNNLYCFVFFIILWGFITESMYVNAKNNHNESLVLFSVVYLTFNMLLFFSNYFALSIPWELLMWCLLIVPLFREKQSSTFPSE